MLLIETVQMSPVSELCLQHLAAFLFLTDNSPTPVTVLLCLVPTLDLLACIYPEHYTFNHTAVVFPSLPALPSVLVVIKVIKIVSPGSALKTSVKTIQSCLSNVKVQEILFFNVDFG